jgi:hypothetical protein
MTTITTNRCAALSALLLAGMLGGCATPSFLSKTPDAADMEGAVIVPDAREGEITKTPLLQPIDDAQVSPDTACVHTPSIRTSACTRVWTSRPWRAFQFQSHGFSSPFTLQRGKENEGGVSKSWGRGLRSMTRGDTLHGE